MGAGSVSGNLERILCRRAQMTAAAGFASLPVIAPTGAANRVSCIYGKIRIESRPPDDVGRSYVASSLCALGSFKHITDARSFALKNGKGQGQSCACR